MTKSTITRERLQEIAGDGFLNHGESKELARMALAAMDSESGCLPLDYLQGHKDGLEWASQLAEANHPETGDWLYDDPIELAKAIRKGPDMPPSQPALDTEPVALQPELSKVVYHFRDWNEGFPVERFKADYVISWMLANYPPAQPTPVVPEEVTDEDCPALVKYDVTEVDEAWARGFNACRSAMLATAPQLPGSEPATVTGKWILVSERMPIEFEAVIAFDGDQVYGEAMHSSDDGFTIDGYDPCDRVQLQNVTHWMPLPAAPQEVKGE
nr:DUF551 domain-containing protein [Klebsiella pneumoniae]